MTLDHAFESKEEICSSLKHHLQDVFAGYGEPSSHVEFGPYQYVLIGFFRRFRFFYTECSDHGSFPRSTCERW
jgi:hypothetical protein